MLNHNMCGEGWAGALRHMRAATCEWTSQYRTAWQLFRIDCLPRLLEAADAPLESLRLVGRGVSVGGPLGLGFRPATPCAQSKVVWL